MTVERIRVVGTVEGEARIGDVVLLGVAARPAKVRADLVIVTAAKERLRIDTTAADLVGPETSKTGAWSELETPELRASLDKEPPPPFTTVELRTRTVQGGDEIEVFGEVSAHEIDPAGYREAPETRPSRIRALLIAVGDDSKESLDRALRHRYPPAKRRAAVDPRRFDPDSDRYRWSVSDLAPVMVYTVILGIVTLLKLSSGKPDAHFIGAVTAILGMLLASWPMRDVPMFREPTSSKDVRNSLLGAARIAILSGLLLGAWVLAAIPILMLLLATAILVMLGYSAWTPRLDLAYVRRLTREPTAPWVRLEGTVEDPTPVRLGDRTIAFGLTKEGGFENRGTFVVRTASTAVEVDPIHTMWASRVTTGSEDQVEAVVPVGGQIVAVGRLQNGKLESEGTTPALLFATGPTGAPLADLRSVLRMRQIVVVGEVTLLVVTLATLVTEGWIR